jgi:hypothetical protein
MIKLLIFSVSLLGSSSIYAFDLEDYATTYRSTRDAYIKAQHELALSKDKFDSMVKFYKANCIKINDRAGFNIKNIDNLISGSCNRDGEKAYVNGGVLPKIYKEKMGDLFFKLFDRVPGLLGSDSSDSGDTNLNPYPRIGGFTGDLEDWHSRYRMKRDATLKASLSDRFTGQDYRLERIEDGCTPTDDSLSKIFTVKKAHFKSGGYWTDLNDEQFDQSTWNSILKDHSNNLTARRNDYIKAFQDLYLATPPFFAAMDAYQAATATYTQSLDCSVKGSGISSNWKLVVDPYAPKIGNGPWGF